MVIKQMIGFLVSLRTGLWLLSLLSILLFAGAFVMPVKEEFHSIHSVPLFQWMPEQDLAVTWWLWGAMGLLVLLTANTLFCSIEAIIRKRSAGQWLLVVSPQVIHIGFLFILLAHLMSGISGFKGMAVAQEGTVLNLPNNATARVVNIVLSIDPYGYLRDWAVDIEYLAEGRTISGDKLMPNKPSFREGIGIYVKDLRAFPDKAILLEISREPGAIWALIGGILFTVGTVTLLFLKMKREG